MLNPKGIIFLLLPIQRIHTFNHKPSHTSFLKKTRIPNWSFLPLQYYNTHLSNTTLDKWKIEKDVCIQDMFNTKSTTSILGKKELKQIQESDLKVLYIDQYLVTINKPSGILSVPGPNRKPSILDLIYTNFAYPNTNPDQMVCHRLDMDTSGILVYARTIEALCTLQLYFKEKNIKKVYEALVCGFLNVDDGEIDLPLESNPECLPFVRVARPSLGKESLTFFQVIRRELLDGYPVTRVRLIPYTGRTHQLRVHCAAIGHPIVGDPIYGLQGIASNVQNELQPALHESIIRKNDISLCLHAKQLYMYHPVTNSPMIFECDPPF